MPLVGNLYPNSENQPKRVENPDVACRKSLPKFPIFLIWVENPSSTARKSLPKQRKSVEKSRESQCHCPEISTQTAKISRKGRESRLASPPVRQSAGPLVYRSAEPRLLTNLKITHQQNRRLHFQGYLFQKFHLPLNS